MAQAQAFPSPKEVERALNRIDEITAQAAATRAAGRELDLEQTMKDACKTYRQVKPAVDKLLSLIEDIGKLFGYDFAKIAAALRKVLDLLDTMCA